MKNDKQLLVRLVGKIDARTPELNRILNYWTNASPLAFMSPESREALRNSMSKLGVNLTRVVVNSHAERETVRGFTRGSAAAPDDALNGLFRSAGLVERSELVHTDRALYGSAYVTVWGSLRDPKRPVAMLDSPRSAAIITDPSTDETLAGVRLWKDSEKRYAAVWTQAELVSWEAPHTEDPLAASWSIVSRETNDLDKVPIVEFARRESIEDSGTSVAADIFDLSDALAKLLTDAMVTSEDYAKPRRWATGLEIEEDEDGNVINPFGKGRNLQSEAPETKFGQLNGASVDSYTGLIATITQLAGMLTGLPPHYLGLHGDQPANADSVKAAEAQLISRVYDELRKLNRPWAEVMALMSAIALGTDPWLNDIVTVFETPELRTPNQASDAAVKLRSLGVPLRNLLKTPLEFSPDEIESIMDNYDAELLQRAAIEKRAGVSTNE